LDILQGDSKKRPTASVLFEKISKEAESSGILFCGTCCLDEPGTTTGSEVDDEHLWTDGTSRYVGI
jgi:hypothetical protein